MDVAPFIKNVQINNNKKKKKEFRQDMAVLTFNPNIVEEGRSLISRPSLVQDSQGKINKKEYSSLQPALTYVTMIIAPHLLELISGNSGYS